MWKSDENSNSCKTAPRIWSQELSEDGIELVGAPAPLHQRPTVGRRCHRRAFDNSSAARYLLFYSANRYDSAQYGVGYATCRGPQGPCTKVTVAAPLLNSQKKCWARVDKSSLPTRWVRCGWRTTRGPRGRPMPRGARGRCASCASPSRPLSPSQPTWSRAVSSRATGPASAPGGRHAVLLHELPISSAFRDAAILQHEDAVGVANRAESMCDNEAGTQAHRNARGHVVR